MSNNVGPCGRRCSALAEAEARACEFEACVLKEIEHEAARDVAEHSKQPKQKPEPMWKRGGIEVDP